MRLFSISIFVNIVKNRGLEASAYVGQIDYIEISNLYNRSGILCTVQRKANPKVAQSTQSYIKHTKRTKPINLIKNSLKIWLKNQKNLLFL